MTGQFLGIFFPFPELPKLIILVNFLSHSALASSSSSCGANRDYLGMTRFIHFLQRRSGDYCFSEKRRWRRDDRLWRWRPPWKGRRVKREGEWYWMRRWIGCVLRVRHIWLGEGDRTRFSWMEIPASREGWEWEEVWWFNSTCTSTLCLRGKQDAHTHWRTHHELKSNRFKFWFS